MSMTRFQNGANTEADNAIFKQLGTFSPTKFHSYFNDFDTYTAGDWTVTEGNAGSTEALTTGDGGLLLLTATNATTDKVYMQLGADSSINGFSMEAGKKAFFEIKFKTSEVTTNGLIAGLHVSNSVDYAPTDGIYFYKPASAATVNFICRKNTSSGSTSASAVATLTANTNVVLSWYYDGIDTVSYAVNGIVLGHLSATSAYLPDTAIGINFGITTAAAANTMTIDYVFAAKER